jgi:hypothetical protein
MGQIAWKRGHRSPHRRGGPTSVMPTGQNVLICIVVMQFYEMKEFESESIDPKWLCRENQESTKHFSVKCNELLSCFTSRLFVLKMTILYTVCMYVD